VYTTQEFGFEEQIDNVSQKRFEEYVDQEEVSAQIAYTQLLLAREKRVADAVMNATTFAGAANVFDITEEWDDADAATPLSDISISAYEKLRAKTGYSLGQASLIMTDDQFKYVMMTDEVVNSVIYTEAVATMSQDRRTQFLADYFHVKEILLTETLYDTAALDAEQSFGKLWSNEYMMLCYLNSSVQSWKEPGLGRMPTWQKFSNDYYTETYEEPQTDSTVVRVREFNGIQLNSRFGVLISNAKTTVGATSQI
jgi:hypothetical protein